MDKQSTYATHLKQVQSLKAYVQDAWAFHFCKVTEQKLSRVIKRLCQWFEVQRFGFFVHSDNAPSLVVAIGAGILQELKGVCLNLKCTKMSQPMLQHDNKRLMVIYALI